MTQQPNEQQDALVTKVRDAIIRAWHDPEFYKNHDLLAQAALAAVREGHVVVPWKLFSEVFATLDSYGVHCSLVDELDECLEHHVKEPHGRAGGDGDR